MSNEDYFIKIPHDVIRIPSFGAVLKKYPTLMPVWSTLVSWGFYQDTPFFGNSNHLQSAFWASIVKSGKLPSTLNLIKLSTVTGFDKRTVAKSLDMLERLHLIEKMPNIDGEDLFCVGHVVKDGNNKIKSFPTFLDSMGRRCDSLAGSWAVQENFDLVLSNHLNTSPFYDIKRGANDILDMGAKDYLESHFLTLTRNKFIDATEFRQDGEWDLLVGNQPFQFILYLLDAMKKLEGEGRSIHTFWESCHNSFELEYQEHSSGIKGYIIAERSSWN